MYPLFDEIEENLAAQPINELETWNQLLPDVEEQRPSEHNPLRLELDMAFVNGASQVPLQALMEDSGFETETKPVRDEASNNSIDSPVHDAVEEQPEPSTSTSTEEVKEDPGVIARFTGGAFRQTSEQVDITISESVNLMVARAVFTGLVFIGVVHSHPQYKQMSINAENLQGSDGQKAPFKVGAQNLKDSKFVSVRPPEASGFGVIHGSVVKMRASSIVNLIFFVLSTNRQNMGHRKIGKLWDLVVLPFNGINAGDNNDEAVDVPEAIWNRRAMCACQVLSVPRKEESLKKKKRNGMATSTETGGEEDEPTHVKRQRLIAQCETWYLQHLQDLTLEQLQLEAERERNF